jgi:FkbM family methyltransferase
VLRTAQKIALARLAYRSIAAWRRLSGRSSVLRATRGHIRWELDLAEGIDLAIYLFGAFERATLRTCARLVSAGDVVLDIGANIGSHVLPLARLVGPDGRVIAFEPTGYAFEKLAANLALNPELSHRVTACRMMLSESDLDPVPQAIYSSWPLDADAAALHAEHRGRLMSTRGAAVAALDGALANLSIKRIDLIKIDVDGNEWSVLRGARCTLERFTPAIVMELAPYLYPREGDFQSLVRELHGLGYRFVDSSNMKPLPESAEDLRAKIARGASMNIVALPPRRARA